MGRPDLTGKSSEGPHTLKKKITEQKKVCEEIIVVATL
jgi:hypothetical protein